MNLSEHHFAHILQNLIERFDYFGQPGFNIDQELKSLVHPVTGEPLDSNDRERIESHFLEHVQYKRSHDTAVLIPVSVVADPKLHQEWYPDWLAKNDDEAGSYYWKRLEQFLAAELSSKSGGDKAGKIVASIDDATRQIMEYVADPKRLEFNYKGLVVGYVQSGKTANFTALIAKAADAGYRFILVLSGIHTALRRQTQIRLDKELTGMNDLSLPEHFIAEPSDTKRWNRITTGLSQSSISKSGDKKVIDLGEFDIINIDPFESICNRSTPTIGIVKKNVTVLSRLISYIEKASLANRKKIQVLVIDDEADQASIDTNANDPDKDPTKINEKIRVLLRLFTRKTYVGYTATPFANVLVNMKATHSSLEDDIYPRNFILSLPLPDGYFGTSLIFSGSVSEQFVVVTPDESNSLIRHGQMTAALLEAVNVFIISCAIRNLRGDKMKPMTMLVHISHKVSDMNILESIISKYLEDIKGRYSDKHYIAVLRNQFQQAWQKTHERSENIQLELKTSNLLPTFEQVFAEIEKVFEVLRVLELNYNSDDRLDYSPDAEVKVIAIGGNQLSRGLTLEGLMVSYYLRSSKQYDTLLQMGRWFGYRANYEDLTRVYTTSEIWKFFEHLALVEDELRAEIYRYQEEKKTPAQLSVAIRDHQTLNVTARNKMGAGQLRQSSFSGSLNQTIWLPLNNPEVLAANYHLGDHFIKEVAKTSTFRKVPKTGISLAKNITGESVLNFLNRYRFVDKEEINGAGLDDELLLEYIHRRLSSDVRELAAWNIAVVGNIDPKFQDDPISYGGLEINRIGRSRRYTAYGYNIGVLTEPEHLTIDLAKNAQSPYDGRDPQTALLLLYLISKDSRASKQKTAPKINERVDLFSGIEERNREDVLGLAIVLPKSLAEPNNYFGQII